MSDGFDTRLRAAETAAIAAALRIEGHERLCAERYETITTNTEDMKKAIDKTNSSIDKTNGMLLKLGFLIGGGMASILVKLVFFP